MGKALFVLLLICMIPTFIWGCFKIGGIFTGVGILLTFSVIVFVGVVVIGAIRWLLG